MAVCDICNEPGMGTLVSAETFRAAIQKGFCPFRLGLDNDMGMAAIREEWRREALQSGTDWNLCNACYTKFEPYAPKATAAVGVNQTQSGGPEDTHLSALAEVDRMKRLQKELESLPGPPVHSHVFPDGTRIVWDESARDELRQSVGTLLRARGATLVALGELAAKAEDKKEAHQALDEARRELDNDVYESDLDSSSRHIKLLRAMHAITTAIVEGKTAPSDSELGLAPSSNCFIATATYGSPFALEVSVFRRFRDEVLLSSIPGSLFVKVYYLVSPPWASLISKAPPLRNATRYLLLAPILSLLKMVERNKD